MAQEWTLSEKREAWHIREEYAVIVGLITPQVSESTAQEYLDELEFLALTAGAHTVRRFVQRLEHPDHRTFIGKGKVEEIRLYLERHPEVGSVIFDDDLTGKQTNNLEKALKVKIIDRSTLILDIFARRAQTAQAKAQVELAQMKYLLPRLRGLWTHLERQRGGIGMRGPGETQIETDRRLVQQRIRALEQKLRAIDQQAQTQRKTRGEWVRVALVGYTNAGKSTLMNLLSKSEVLVEDRLFATLDTTVRKVVFGQMPFLLSDTVGFIRKLPHHLVESFKSTLDEVRESDLLLHVVDVAHPQFEDHIRTVQQTLVDIGARVLRIDGRPLSSSDALVRALLLLVDGAFSLGCIGFLAIQGNARGQRLGDIAAHTVVVYVGKSTVTLSDVLGIVTQEHYTVTYPQVRQLRESDLLVVKQVLYRRRRYLNAAHHLVAERLAERLAEVLNLPKSETKDTYLFLEAILRDYVVLTR